MMKVKYSSCEQKVYPERKVIEARISQGIELLEQGQIKSLEELARILVDKRPLNVIFQEFQKKEGCKG